MKAASSSFWLFNTNTYKNRGNFCELWNENEACLTTLFMKTGHNTDLNWKFCLPIIGFECLWFKFCK